MSTEWIRPPMKSPTTFWSLSTIHQAKGLEWSHVFVPRLIEDSFPHRRSVDEPGGEDEERRIFYVAITRAMNELTLTYPVTIAMAGRGPTVFTTPSRFLTEIDQVLLERGEIDDPVEDGCRGQETSLARAWPPRPETSVCDDLRL